jgi:hypothetical protein
MIPAPVLHGPEHKSADIPRSKAFQPQPLELEPLRQELLHDRLAVTYSGLAERSLANQIPGVASNKKFDWVQGRFGCFGNEVSLTEGAQ